MSHAHTLIYAINTGDCKALKKAVAELVKNPPKGWTKKAYAGMVVNTGLSGTGITPLHVACKAYSAFEGKDARQFQQMIGFLLACGASHGTVAKLDGRMFTAYECCGKKVPSCMRKHVSDCADKDVYTFCSKRPEYVVLASGYSEHRMSA